MAAVLDKDVLDVLNDLIETAKDGEYGFAKCAERVKSPQLQQTLQRRAEGCRNAARELQVLVAQYGGQPAEGGTVMGAIHRGWVSVKDTLSADSDRAVLDEAERGEDHALARFRKALKAQLPNEVLSVVVRQMEGAQVNHDEIKLLRDSTRT